MLYFDHHSLTIYTKYDIMILVSGNIVPLHHLLIFVDENVKVRNVNSYYQVVIFSYCHDIILSQHQMFEVIFGPKSRFSTHIEPFTPSPRKSPQK